MNGPLTLSGWRWKSDRPVQAILSLADGSSLYIAPMILLGAPEYLSRLTEADKQEIAGMVLKGGAS